MRVAFCSCEFSSPGEKIEGKSKSRIKDRDQVVNKGLYYLVVVPFSPT